LLSRQVIVAFVVAVAPPSSLAQVTNGIHLVAKVTAYVVREARGVVVLEAKIEAASRAEVVALFSIL